MPSRENNDCRPSHLLRSFRQIQGVPSSGAASEHSDPVVAIAARRRQGPSFLPGIPATMNRPPDRGPSQLGRGPMPCAARREGSAGCVWLGSRGSRRGPRRAALFRQLGLAPPAARALRRGSARSRFRADWIPSPCERPWHTAGPRTSRALPMSHKSRSGLLLRRGLRRFKAVLELIRFGHDGQARPAFPYLLMTGGRGVLAVQVAAQDRAFNVSRETSRTGVLGGTLPQPATSAPRRRAAFPSSERAVLRPDGSENGNGPHLTLEIRQDRFR